MLANINWWVYLVVIFIYPITYCDGAPNGSVDNRILALALAVRKREPGTPTILVTKDINLRLKADVYGLPAEDYETDRVNLKDLYTGMFDLVVPVFMKYN